MINRDYYLYYYCKYRPPKGSCKEVGNIPVHLYNDFYNIIKIVYYYHIRGYLVLEGFNNPSYTLSTLIVKKWKLY